MTLPMMPHEPRILAVDSCPHCGMVECPDPVTCERCTCTTCEMRRRQTFERMERNRQRLIGQGTVQERVADDRAAYGGGPQEIRP